jgi:hypothetical protein
VTLTVGLTAEESCEQYRRQQQTLLSNPLPLVKEAGKITEGYNRRVMRSAFCGKSIRKRSTHHAPERGKKKNKEKGIVPFLN